MGIHIRERERSDGTVTLYLDIYRRGYKRTTQTIFPPFHKADKAKRKEVYRIAEILKSRKEFEIATDMYATPNPMAKGMKFLAFYKSLKDQYLKNRSYQNVRMHLEKLHPDTCFPDITSHWLDNLRDEWLKELSPNSVLTYFKILNAVLNKAVKAKLIPSNPMKDFEKPKERESIVTFLNPDELQKLAATWCTPSIKRAFFFAVQTGLRKNEIHKLRWEDIHGDYLQVEQSKTEAPILKHLSPEARRILAMIPRSQERPFMFSQTVTPELYAWADAAGVRRFGFHSSRHTFATALLRIQKDVYAVQKAIGHKDIQTTQRYAELIDEDQHAALDSQPAYEWTE
jgi:integrase